VTIQRYFKQRVIGKRRNQYGELRGRGKPWDGGGKNVHRWDVNIALTRKGEFSKRFKCIGLDLGQYG
jgi:hypothetical protein